MLWSHVNTFHAIRENVTEICTFSVTLILMLQPLFTHISSFGHCKSAYLFDTWWNLTMRHEYNGMNKAFFVGGGRSIWGDISAGARERNTGGHGGWGGLEECRGLGWCKSLGTWVSEWEGTTRQGPGMGQEPRSQEPGRDRSLGVGWGRSIWCDSWDICGARALGAV